MSYVFKGNLCAYLCPDCKEYLSFVTVRLYRLRDKRRITVLATADPKHTVAWLDAKQIKGKEKHLIAEAETDAKGNFTFTLDEKRHRYDGDAFELDVYVRAVPGQDAGAEETHEPVQFTVTALQPQWRQREDAFVWYWEYCLSSRFWCALRELFGWWVICGTVLHCKTQRPVPGVRVIAFDRDWLQDDTLGAALTDTAGRFRIYYPKSAFLPGTVLDVELFGGPDLYFHVETALGAPLLTEPPSRGRDADRQNVGPCFCVTLCLEETPPDEKADPLPVFTHLGVYNYENDVNSLPGQDGLTKTGQRAFHANVRLNGVLPKTLNGNPMEYRFETQELDAAGIPLGPWTPVSAARIAKTKIGVLERANPDFPALSPNPIETVDYVVGAPDADELAAAVVTDAHGDWIRVPQESASPLSATGFFQPNGDMIRLITSSLASFGTVDLEAPGPLAAGQNATATGRPLVQNRHFALRMLVREVGAPGAGMTAGYCRNVAIENTKYRTLHHPAWMAVLRPSALAVAMVDIDELVVDGCSGLDTTLTVNYTAAHPNLGSVSLTMSGPGGPYPLALTPDAAATPENAFGTATLVPPDTVAGLDPCAYIITLSVQVLLTTGDSVPDNLVDQIAFCKV
ncbi:carboxypeptidase-like regulatory domain-containing protein [Rhodocaloribacter sp.]